MSLRLLSATRMPASERSSLLCSLSRPLAWIAILSIFVSFLAHRPRHKHEKSPPAGGELPRQVIGIEYVPEAIEDAKVNAEINDIKNTLFYAGDMKDILTQEFINEHGRPDVIITDPPRAGMHQDVVDVILFAEPKRIVYVSCNPATQARDLQLLDEKYKVKAVQPVDMFPHTHHVENVVLLELR